MKKTVLTAGVLLALFVSLVGAAYSAGLQSITGEELSGMMKKGDKLVIVDVREPELYARGHIQGAINIPYDYAKPRILKELSAKDTIVFVCHSGPMGVELGDILVQNGYQKVYNVKGGMLRWRWGVVK